MTYKQLKTLTEIRLLTGQIVIPAIGIVVTIMKNPEIKQNVKTAVNKVKQFNKNKTQKLKRVQ